MDFSGGSGSHHRSSHRAKISQSTAISSAFYGNKIPYQIVSNGGSGQQQTTVQGQFSNFSNSLGYGAGGSGGAAGTSNGPGPNGSQGGAGAPGFIRIYWLNTA